MKKWIAAMLALVMALALCTVSWAGADNYVTIDGLVDENGALVHYETLTAAAKAWREKNSIGTQPDGTAGATYNFGGHPAELTEIDSIVWTIHGTVDTGNGDGVIGSANTAILSGGYIYPAVAVKKIIVKGEAGATIMDSVSAGKSSYTYIGGSGADVTIENVTFPEYAYANSQNTSITFTNCKFQKGLKVLQALEVNVKESEFTNDGTTEYALFVQNGATKVELSGNTISGYQRGINVQASDTANVTISGNTIKDLVGKTGNDSTKYGAAIQLTSAKTFTVEGNTIANVPVNALHIYKNCAANIAINSNNIDAAYLLLNEAPDTATVTSADNTVSAKTNTTKGLMKNGEFAETTTTINVKVPTSNNYYYYSPSTTTDTTKGSPKTFDAGIALYVGMALTSAAGVAFVGKKRGN